MESFKRSPFFSLFSIIIVLVAPLTTLAQDSPQDFVAAHNAARAEVGVGPVQWDQTVADFAQDYANQRARDNCNLIHSDGPYGENLATGSSVDLDAVGMWVAEKADYDYNTNTCAPNKMCGHYTQIVWRDSVHIGCAKVRCSSGGTFISCNYDPRGNYPGKKPY